MQLILLILLVCAYVCLHACVRACGCVCVCVCVRVRARLCMCLFNYLLICQFCICICTWCVRMCASGRACVRVYVMYVCSGWMARDRKLGLPVHTTWHLISSTWYRMWLDYTGVSLLKL